jgi:hypothetical protein
MRLLIVRLSARALIGAALTGLLYLLSRLELVSFVPLDAADTMILLTPGAVATQTIEIGTNTGTI